MNGSRHFLYQTHHLRSGLPWPEIAFAGLPAVALCYVVNQGWSACPCTYVVRKSSGRDITAIRLTTHYHNLPDSLGHARGSLFSANSTGSRTPCIRRHTRLHRIMPSTTNPISPNTSRCRPARALRITGNGALLRLPLQLPHGCCCFLVAHLRDDLLQNVKIYRVVVSVQAGADRNAGWRLVPRETGYYLIGLEGKQKSRGLMRISAVWARDSSGRT